MLCSTKELDGFELAARDGAIGRAREVYFDDERWVIRHVIVDTDGWFTGDRVLISPHAIERIDGDARRLDVALSREQVKNAPPIHTDKPVWRQQEMAYYDYYGYPYYWAGPGLWGMGALPLPAMRGLAAPSSDVRAMGAAVAADREKSFDPNLRSSKEVTGYDVEAIDGAVGHVEDFLFDDRSWQIRFVVVDTRDWLPGRHVLVSPDWIDRIEWGGKRARFTVTRQAIEASPPYRKGSGLSDEDVRSVQRHFESSV